MNQKLLSGLTATLLITTLGTPAPGNTKPTQAVDRGSEANLNPASSQPSNPALATQGEVVKVGEQQTKNPVSGSEEVIAKVHAHALAGREAATLYVRNIPVLTFIGSQTSAPEQVKLGSQQSEANRGNAPVTTSKSLDSADALNAAASEQTPSTEKAANQEGPLWRASAIAARLNELSRNGLDANSITVSWNAQATNAKESYVIRAKDEVLAVLGPDTILPDTTRDLEVDALQATNRLRRLLGNASPLNGVSGKPRQRQEISLGPVRFQVNGFASWYGPGFHGNMSASGEIFNQNALTAAHRTLPFGTRVRVTNLDNGQSVVVRINDRGPFHGNRVIDLSAGAARVLGVISSGIAPVRLDVMDERNAMTPGN